MEINLVKSTPCNLFGTKYEEDVNCNYSNLIDSTQFCLFILPHYLTYWLNIYNILTLFSNN